MNQPRRYNQRRMQHDNRRRYRQPQQHQHYRRPTPRYRRETRQKEIIKDLDHAIELFVPCGRYCNYYEARIIPQQSIGHPRNQQTIQVSGPGGYKKSWDIPRNVDIDGITKSIVYSQYLKLSFPKFYESINGFEIPDNTNPHINEHYHSNSNNINNNNNNNEEVKQNHHAGRRTEKRREHSKYNDIYNNRKQTERHRMYENIHDEIKRTKSNLHQRKHQHQNNNQEVIDPYFYATSEGIEIIDVDANEIEAELYQKDQKASIGFWNSRGKFQFY
jgi:hypothetical protein